MASAQCSTKKLVGNKRKRSILTAMNSPPTCIKTALKLPTTMPSNICKPVIEKTNLTAAR